MVWSVGAGPLAVEHVGARVDFYVDESIQVVSPTVEGQLDLSPKVGVTGRYSVDVLSGATRTQAVDMISSATTFNERRHQGNLSSTIQHPNDRTTRLAYTLSYEPDYLSNLVSVGFSKELFERMSTMRGAYRLGYDSFGTTAEEAINGWAFNQGADLSWSQILSRRNQGTISLTGDYIRCAESLGCQSSAYRYVPVVDMGETMAVMSLRERHPAMRLRGAGALRFSQALAPDLALHASYRYYADTWMVHGHTGNLAVAKSLLEEQVVLRASTRGGWQSRASFYRDDYVENARLPEYRSADSELAGVTSAMVRGQLERNWSAVGPLLNFGLSLRVARFWYRYHELAELPARWAWLVGGGANGSF